MAQIGIKFLFLFFISKVKVPTFKILVCSRQKTQIRPVPNMYNHTKINKRRGGWFNFDHKVIFYPFFSSFSIFYTFFLTLLRLFYLFFLTLLFFFFIFFFGLFYYFFFLHHGSSFFLLRPLTNFYHFFFNPL